MAYTVMIPQNKHAAEMAITRLISEGEIRRNPVAVRWWISHWYMRGVRDFDHVNYLEGTVQVGYFNSDSVLKFQYEDILAKYQTQAGRLLGIDLRPAIMRRDRGITLDGLRKSSVAQVVLSSIMTEEKVDRMKEDAIGAFLQYGTVGFSAWAKDEDSMGVEIIMPWELIPLPIDLSDPSEERGIMRVRWVPLDWVKSQRNVPGKGADVWKDVETLDVPAGDMPAQVRQQYMTTAAVATHSQTAATNVELGRNELPPRSANKGQGQQDIEITKYCEIWTETDDGYLGEYLQWAGGKLLYRKDYTQANTLMPVAVARDIRVGGFWGRSFCEAAIPLNTEMEWAVGHVFQQIQEFDLYGIIFEPTNAGIPNILDKGEDGLRRARYEPDYVSPDIKPFNMAPARFDQSLTNAVKMGAELQNMVVNQPSELTRGDAPGRVDSSSALGALHAMSNIPLSPGALSLSLAVIGVYKSLLQAARDTWSNTKVVEINHLDDSIAGLKMDPQTGTVALDDNAIPHPDEVQVDVASRLPVDREQQKMEMMELLDKGLLTPFEFNIQSRIRGLDLPVGNPIEWQNYRKAIFNNIALFGDGETPGTVIMTGREMPSVHLYVINAFMAKPEFALASEVVRAKFGELRSAFEMQVGMPEGMEYAEDTAGMRMEELQAAQQMAPPGQMAQGAANMSQF